MTIPTTPVEEMSNDVLLNEMMIWFRIGRNEDGLKGEERAYFKKVCDEILKRNLLPRRYFND